MRQSHERWDRACSATSGWAFYAQRPQVQGHSWGQWQDDVNETHDTFNGHHRLLDYRSLIIINVSSTIFPNLHHHSFLDYRTLIIINIIIVSWTIVR